MHDKLLFFPPSLPNESLVSRVSRYHLMSGNRTEQSTFMELFGRTGFMLSGVVPSYIEVLAARLPGDEDTNLATIIQDNTLLPVFRPFLGKPNKKTSLSPNKDGESNDISHLPKHVVGMSGDAKLCLSCIKDDELARGAGYWHRSHQIPGVSVCWKHQEQLINSCPNCRFPFQRPNRLLSLPWSPCRCNDALVQNAKNGHFEPLELTYAIYAHELLLENMAPVSPEVIMNTYRAKMKEKGYVRGTMPALKDFQEAMIDELGQTFIKKADPAFSANRARWWLRLTYVESALDMPITRHLMLGMYLFGSAHNFNNHVQANLSESNASVRKKGSKVEQNQNTLRDEFRKKILAELNKGFPISMEKLWKKQVRAVAWLFDHDKTWLNNTIAEKEQSTAHKSGIKIKSDEEVDQEYARLAEDYSRKLFEAEGKPQRVSIGKILDGLPKKIGSDSKNRERFPVLFSTVDLCRESSWCFSARRILWAIGELERFGENIVTGNIAMRSAVGFRAVEDIMRFCKWDGEQLSNTAINPKALLAKAGIARTWRGPSDLTLGKFAGRGYKKKNNANT